MTTDLTEAVHALTRETRTKVMQGTDTVTIKGAA